MYTVIIYIRVNKHGFLLITSNVSMQKSWDGLTPTLFVGIGNAKRNSQQ